MDRSEYYSRLASIIVGAPCFVSITGTIVKRDSGGGSHVIVLPDRSMSLGILAGIMDLATMPESTNEDSYSSLDLPTIKGIDNQSTFRFLVERMALYLECGRILYPPLDSLPETEVERLIFNVLEYRRVESLLSLSFPALEEKFQLVNRLLMIGASPTISNNDCGDSITTRARSVLLAALKVNMNLSSCNIDDTVVSRTAELMNLISKSPMEEGIVSSACREIFNLIKSEEVSTKVVKPGEDDRAREATGFDSSQEKRASEDGTEDIDELTDLLIEEVVSILAEVSKEMSLIDLSDDLELPHLASTDKSGELIDQRVMKRTADILRRIRGSLRSYDEILRDEGYAINVDEFIQFKAGNSDTRNLYYNYRKDRSEYDIVICLDRSASMDGARLDHAMKSTATLVRALEMADISVAITAYDETSTIVKPWNQSVSDSALGDIIASGGTSIAQALQVANNLLTSRKRRVGVTRRQAIILVSDGHDYYLERIAAQIAIARRRGVNVYYIGIGEQCRQFLRMGAAHFRYDHSVLIERGDHISEALSSLARAFLRESGLGFGPI